MLRIRIEDTYHKCEKVGIRMYGFISLSISIVALVISVLSFLFARKDESVHRRNSIKPILMCESVRNYERGDVPNARWDVGDENGIDIPIYLVIKNYGVGTAVNVMVEIILDKKLNHKVMLPAVVESNNQIGFFMQIERIRKECIGENGIKVLLNYWDVDGNVYVAKLSGVLLTFGEDNFFKVTKNDYAEKIMNKFGPCDEVAKYYESEW